MGLADNDLPPIFDTHVHFWDKRDPNLALEWSWLDPTSDHPILGNIDCMKALRYDIEGVWAEARFAGVEAFVHVQAAIGSADPVDETRWLERTRATAPVPFAMVGHADLEHAGAIEAQLDAHLAASPAFAGVRDFAVEPILEAGETERLDAGLRALSDRGLVLDLDCGWPNMAEAASMAGRHPDLAIVLEHIGFPRSRDDSYFADWSRSIRELSKSENVTCKVSGLGMTDTRFTRDSLRRWVETCLEAFGPDRLVVGSNWPIDRLYSSYDVVMAIIRGFVTTMSVDEQARVLSGNARRLYLLDVSHSLS